MDNQEKALSWFLLSILVVIIIISVWYWVTPNEPYVIKVEYCQLGELDLEVAQTVCVQSCTTQFPFNDNYDKLKVCYQACKS
ncbi:MAG: hypothetical protein A2Y62_14305 [Candidatus Fischerbacteria bacterium RBG_13_37_8]|uniref:Transmembrane protein n=1 Tax=Candidatus Fischerbacteria bacterium RBG_13_37_8 TaxID=1817863 RepID=A0A1F5VH90_9BACT|nr:MAG: hypothetical protein A2Y62_14305 [Candidatus Fischerbacteria bacterium RBG_13_37_8]